jgi:hypothetical protein
MLPIGYHRMAQCLRVLYEIFAQKEQAAKLCNMLKGVCVA